MKKNIDFEKAFLHIFDDDQWIIKVLIGSLISIVPILWFAAVGYEVQVARNVTKGDLRPMPDWDDLGRFFGEGLKLGLARLLVALPLLLIFFLSFGSIFAAPFAAALLVPDLDSAEGERLMGLVMAGTMLLFLISMLVASVFSFVLGFLYPAMTASYVRQGTFASCFNVREIVDFIRRNTVNYLLVWLAGILAGMLYAALYMGLSFIPCLGSMLAIPLSVVAIFYIYMVNGHALGQAMALDQLPAPAQPPAVESPV